MLAFFFKRYLILVVLLSFLGCVHTRKGRFESASIKKGVAVSASMLASKAGSEILRRGGTAIDASIAMEFALAVVCPYAGNIGGGGFSLIRTSEGEVSALDFREKAPIAAYEEMYLDSAGDYVVEKSKHGHLAVGVPGTVAGMYAMHQKYGTLPFYDLLQPAISLAGNGFVIEEKLSRRLNENLKMFARYQGSSKYFTKGDTTTLWVAGDTLIQKDLSETLKLIATKGRDGFYKGLIADRIVKEMKRGQGIITRKDLDSYQPVWRTPIRSAYKGLEIFSTPPPSSGGIIVSQLLRMMSFYDLPSLGFHSTESVHLMAHAMKQVFIDRSMYIGDPDFFDVPLEGLLSESYLRERMSSFSSDTTASRSRSVSPFEKMETTHYSVVDRYGNAVSTTTTLNRSFGSSVAVDEAGFLLNNEMDDFSSKPGEPNLYGAVGGEANRIEPGKRMLSSISSTIVCKDDRFYFTVGTPGGTTIPTTVFQVIVNIVDFKMSPSQAVEVPRFHHQWKPKDLFYEQGVLGRGTTKELQKKGWKLNRRSPYGRAKVILSSNDGTLKVGADPRDKDEFAWE